MRFDSTRALLLAATLLAATAAAAESDLQERARAAYDAGDCATALPLLEQIDKGGQANGPWIYRLYYCQREAGRPAARETAGRARAALEAEFEKSPSLETGFYLANAYRNAARISSAAEVATRVTSAIEMKKMPGPRTPMETFWLGKLYADQENAARAAELYAQSLEGLHVPGETASPTVSWAARYLAERAWDAEDWAGAARYYGMVDPASGSQQDFDRLATALVHQSDYRAAAKAWFQALRLNPAGGDRARYCAQLATQAADVAPLPETAPDGRDWSELTGPDLGDVLYEKAKFANETLAAVTADPDGYTDERRLELHHELQEARAYFVTAGLEAVVRGIPLRETAFQSGYAPLIFHKTRWTLPQQRKGKGPWRPTKRAPAEPKDDPRTGGSGGS